MALLPSTARNLPQAGYGPELYPHAESHELKGNDPVLGGVIYHGGATLTGDVALTASVADVAGLSRTVYARGGTLMIMLSGQRQTAGVIAAANIYQAELETRAVVGSTNLKLYTEQSEVRLSTAELTLARYEFASTLTWLSASLPGVYTVKIQAFYGGDSTSGSFRIDATMQVFELLPVRRP